MRTLLVILGLSTLVKLALLWPAERLPLRGDERQYVAGAASIAATGVPDYPNPVWDEAHSSPLYPYGLGLVHRVFGPAGFAAAARTVQVLLSTLIALLVYLIAVRAFDRRVALTATGVTAFFPTIVAYSHYFYTETLYTALFVGIPAVLLGGARPPGAGRVLAAGVVAGLAALARGAYVIQAPFVLLWLLAAGGPTPQRRARAAALFLLGMAIPIAPWSARNTIRYDRFLLIDTNGGNVLHKNWNAIRQENHDVGMDKRWRADRVAYTGPVPFRERVEAADPVERDRAETRAALRFVLAHPLLFARHSLIRAAEFVNPTSFLVRAVRLGDYPGLGPVASEIVVWSVLASTMAVLAFGAIGLAARPPGPVAALPALMILGNVVVCVLIVSMSRYRFPMTPLLIPFAVHGAIEARRFFAGRSPLRFAVLAVLAALAAAWVVYVPYSL
jgi:4-amino-4-deoxy-L-arabinose transferase-like glycosyltransferase